MEWLLALLTLLVSNLLLSGDNAVVIAMAAHRLPARQRKLAMLWGALGAIVLRVLLTSVAFYLLNVPLLQAAGGVILLWVGAKLLITEEQDAQVGAHESLGAAVRTILIADVVMSLDNVLAVAGVSRGNLVLMLVGLVLSMPPILFGASLLERLMTKVPWLMYVGSGILGWVAGDMFVTDGIVGPWLLHAGDWMKQLLPILTAVAVVWVGHWLGSRKDDGPRPQEQP